MEHNIISEMIYSCGIFNLSLGNIIMWIIGMTLIYLAIAKKFEPLLLLPIGFGILVSNLPITDLMKPGEGLIWRFYHYGLQWEVIPPLIFLGLGALTDFGPLLARPSLIFLGAGAQVGVYITFFCAKLMGFSLDEAAAIGIIGGADGPTTIYVTSKLAPHLLGSCAVAAYSYMALVPIIQPPVIKLFTTKAERQIVMKKSRRVSTRERIMFPILATLVVILLFPPSAPLMAMFMLGNLFKESGVVERLSGAAQNELMNIVTIFLGVSVGATMDAATFLKPQSLMIFFLGAFAFASSTATGVIVAKIMNLFLKDKINPMIGAAGVSAVPMSARVVHVMGQEENKKNYLLMHAMGPNIAGVIGTIIAASIFIGVLK
jgi:oxaloacetate decarboxylase beta subunit